MTKPVLLDIGCCQGAVSHGYERVGFEVIGMDIVPQPRYPGRMVVADGIKALETLAEHGRLWYSGLVIRPEVVHMSWPCQAYTDCQRIRGNEHPRLIEPGRELVQTLGIPYVMENVAGAPLKDPITLCGATFGLRTYRHRLFESNVPLTQPEHEAHPDITVKMGRPLREGDWYHAVGNFSGVDYVRRDLGLPWMNRDGLRECAPWQYAEYVGKQVMMVL